MTLRRAIAWKVVRKPYIARRKERAPATSKESSDILEKSVDAFFSSRYGWPAFTASARDRL
jgi:hypothetical protein